MTLFLWDLAHNLHTTFQMCSHEWNLGKLILQSFSDMQGILYWQLETNLTRNPWPASIHTVLINSASDSDETAISIPVTTFDWFQRLWWSCRYIHVRIPQMLSNRHLKGNPCTGNWNTRNRIYFDLHSWTCIQLN